MTANKESSKTDGLSSTDPMPPAGTLQNLQTLPAVSAAADHATGTCNPCVFFYSKYCCGKGNHCDFCHLSHAREEANRPRKERRERSSLKRFRFLEFS